MIQWKFCDVGAYIMKNKCVTATIQDASNTSVFGTFN